MRWIIRVGLCALVALVAVGLLAVGFALRPHLPAASAPRGADQPPVHAAPAAPSASAAKPTPKDSTVKVPDPNSRLLDAYLFFLAAFESHRARGR